jgi:glycosyltransferase involved in cell wall biosynthesis
VGDPPRIRVAHVVPDLALGGTETALVRLLENLDRTRFASLVITLRDGGALVERARRSADDVVSLHMGSRLPSPLVLARLRGVLRAFVPDVVQGWLYHGNLAAWAGARLARTRPALVWNVRQSLADVAHERPLTRLVIRAGATLSTQSDAIVNNSRTSIAQHAQLGFDASRTVHVPNGFDTTLFRPSDAARAALRAELGLRPDALLAGLVARFDPVKRHDLFLAAVAGAVRSGLDLHAVLAGSGVDRANARLRQAIGALRLDDRVHLLGTRHEPASLLPALDVLVSASSRAEGFPNVVGEAMACGVPCLVTDTGDCAAIVADAGIVVPPGDATPLAEALVRLLRAPAAERIAMGERGRDRITSTYRLEQCVARYAELYAALVRDRAAATRQILRPDEQS